MGIDFDPNINTIKEEEEYVEPKQVKYRTQGAFLSKLRSKRESDARNVGNFDKKIPKHFKNFIRQGQSPIDFRIEVMKKYLDRLDVDFDEATKHEKRCQTAKNQRAAKNYATLSRVESQDPRQTYSKAG
jgi:hypothetical protein